METGPENEHDLCSVGLFVLVTTFLPSWPEVVVPFCCLYLGVTHVFRSPTDVRFGAAVLLLPDWPGAMD